MTRLTTKKVKEYVAKRSNQDLRHCPNCIAAACNEAAYKFGHNSALDLLKLLFFNDPIPALHTHSYSFNSSIILAYNYRNTTYNLP